MTHSSEIDKDVQKMIEKRVEVYLVEEDAKDRGLADGDLIAGIKKVEQSLAR